MNTIARTSFRLMAAVLPTMALASDPLVVEPDWTIVVENASAISEPLHMEAARFLPDARLIGVGRDVTTFDASLDMISTVPTGDHLLGIKLMPEGGDIRWSNQTLYRVDADGHTRFRIDCPESACSAFPGAEDGVILVRLNHVPPNSSAWLEGHDRRGRPIWRTPDFAPLGEVLAVRDESADLIYSIHQIDSSIGSTSGHRLVVHAHDLAGESVWRWQSSERASIFVHDFKARLDGGMAIALLTQEANDAPQVAQFLRFEAYAGLVDAVRIEQPTQQVLGSEMALGGAGGGYHIGLLYASGYRFLVTPFAADGRVGSASEVPFESRPNTPPARWQVLADGDLIFTRGSDIEIDVARFSADGLLYSQRIPVQAGAVDVVHLLESDRDDLVLVLGDAPAWNAQVREFIVLSPSGELLDRRSIPSSSRPMPAYSLALTTENGGRAFVAYRNATPGLTIVARNSEAALLWQSGVEVTGLEVPRSLQTCGDARLCLVTGNNTWLLNAATGELLDDSLPPAQSIKVDHEGLISLLQADSRICLMGLCSYDYRRVTRSAEGIIQSRDVSGVPMAHGNDGSLLSLLSTPPNGADLRLLDVDGAETIFLEQPPTTIIMAKHRLGGTVGPHSALLGDDGRATFLVRDCSGDRPNRCSGHLVQQFSAAQRIWSAPIAASIASSNEQEIDDWQFFEDQDGNVLLLLSHGIRTTSPPSAENALYLLKISATGDRLFERHWTAPGFGASRLHQVREHGALALIRQSRDSSALNILVIDADSGEIRSERRLACPSGRCRHWLAAIDTEATLKAVVADDHGLTLLQASDFFDEPDSLPVGNPGLSGAWFTPDIDGQGFTLRVHRGTEGMAVFMPWYTFDNTGENTAEQQRWYVLEAQVGEELDDIDLEISQIAHGQFPGAGQASAVVGSARLRLVACDRALLDYHFDRPHNHGKQGTITLQRLLASPRECDDASAYVENPAISGTWYSPAAPGQGLEIQHLTTGHNAGTDQLFGAWYTFAPVNTAGASNNQRWFSLQDGSLRADASMAAVIYRTLGGRFDSTETGNTFRAGVVHLTPQGCDRLDLNYHFDDHADAGEFRNLSGSIQLYRLGRCPDP